MGRLLLCQEGRHTAEHAAVSTAEQLHQSGWSTKAANRSCRKLGRQRLDWSSHCQWSSSPCQEEAQVYGPELSHDVNGLGAVDWVVIVLTMKRPGQPVCPWSGSHISADVHWEEFLACTLTNSAMHLLLLYSYGNI